MKQKSRRKRKSGLTKAQEKKVADIKASGGVVPVGLFGIAEDPRVVADRVRLAASNAAGPHVSSSVPRDRAAGRNTRVGSRRSARNAAVRDFG